ncbi:MAG TPA: HD domain-containing phosphohydrolase [Dehalococcoidales bacterium]
MTNQRERILIVDDEAAIRRLLCRKLSRQGYHCEEAGSAMEALDMMRSYSAELIMLDMKMPGKSGIDLLPELKATYPNTAVIMATAVTETSLAIQCMKQGADDYIGKPFNLDEVALSVDKTLEKRRLELQIKEYQEHLQQKVNQQTVEIRRLFLGAIEALVFALEAKDKYTAGHSRRVTDIALAIGRELNLPEDDIEDLRWGSLLHDVGKIAVDQFVQNKPGKLTPAEYEHIMIHAQVGAGIVKPVVNDSVMEIVGHHHDHYDGTGLHQVVVGKDIPLGARILAVADAFDAVTSNRPYRPAMPVEEARQEIRRCIGTQFDPVVANAFLGIGASGIVLEKGKATVVADTSARP